MTPEFINIDDYVVSGDGYTATSYTHKDGKTMIKLYEPFISDEKCIHELMVAKHVKELGIDSPTAFRYITDGKRKGVEFELLKDKRSFARAISQEPEKLEEYSRSFARMCRELHNTECDTTFFHDVNEEDRKIIESNRIFSDQVKKNALKFIDSIPPKTTCLHMDMHIGNALMIGDRKVWIDLETFKYGNPIFDLGMMAMIATSDPAIVERLYHVSYEEFGRIYRFFIDEYFEGNISSETLQLIEYSKALQSIRILSFDNPNPLLIKTVNEIFA